MANRGTTFSERRFMKTLLLTALLFLSGIAKSEGVSEYDVKAGFLLNFSKFIEWPESGFPSSDSPFVLGIYGENPFGESIFLLEKQQVQGRPVSVRILQPGTRDLSGVQMLFIPASQERAAADLIRELRQKPVVLVGEIPGFSRAGGTINFYRRDQHIAFEINLRAVQDSRLDVSSRLLRLAQIVNGDSP